MTDSGLDQGISNGCGEKEQDSGYILKVKSTGMPDGLDVTCKRKRLQDF